MNEEIHHENQLLPPHEWRQKSSVKRRLRRCGPLINLDAVKYYRNQRERKLYLIDKLLKKRQYNTGRAFIVFKSSQQVRKATDPSFFQAVYELDNVLIDRLDIL